LFPNGGIFKKRARRHNPFCFWEPPTAKKKTAILPPENRIIVPAPSADGDGADAKVSDLNTEKDTGSSHCTHEAFCQVLF